jgi:hypothetical protein
VSQLAQSHADCGDANHALIALPLWCSCLWLQRLLPTPQPLARTRVQWCSVLFKSRMDNEVSARHGCFCDIRRIWNSGRQRCVVHRMQTDVSVEHVASLFRVRK